MDTHVYEALCELRTSERVVIIVGCWKDRVQWHIHKRRLQSFSRFRQSVIVTQMSKVERMLFAYPKFFGLHGSTQNFLKFVTTYTDSSYHCTLDS